LLSVTNKVQISGDIASMEYKSFRTMSVEY
jgi:hypothetical protein